MSEIYNGLLSSLHRFVSDATCFRVMLAARGAGCDSIARRAANHALQNFSQASVQDVSGLRALTIQDLTQFVQVGALPRPRHPCHGFSTELHDSRFRYIVSRQCDSLKVSSELDVFRALEAWVGADLETRKVHFAELLRTCLASGDSGPAASRIFILIRSNPSRW
jgi:hypothetical protein